MTKNDQGQDVAEYAVILAVILVLVFAMIRMVGIDTNKSFSSVSSSLSGDSPSSGDGGGGGGGGHHDD